MTEKRTQLKIGLQPTVDGAQLSRQLKTTISSAVKQGLKSGLAGVSKDLAQSLAPAITAAIKEGFQGARQVSKKHAENVAKDIVDATAKANDKVKLSTLGRARQIELLTGQSRDAILAQLKALPAVQQVTQVYAAQDEKRRADFAQRDTAKIARAQEKRAREAERLKEDARKFSKYAGVTEDEAVAQLSTLDRYGRKEQISLAREAFADRQRQDRKARRAAEAAKDRVEAAAARDQDRADRAAEKAQRQAEAKAAKEAAKAAEGPPVAVRRQARQYAELSGKTYEEALAELGGLTPGDRYERIEAAKAARGAGGAGGAGAGGGAGGAGGAGGGRRRGGRGGAGGGSPRRYTKFLTPIAALAGGIATGNPLGGAAGGVYAGFGAAGLAGSGGLGTAALAGPLAFLGASGAAHYRGFSAALEQFGRGQQFALGTRGLTGLASAEALSRPKMASAIEYELATRAQEMARKYGLTTEEAMAAIQSTAQQRGGFIESAGLMKDAMLAGQLSRQGIGLETSGAFARARFRGGNLSPGYDVAAGARGLGFQGAEIGQYGAFQAGFLERAGARGVGFDSNKFDDSVRGMSGAVGLPQASRLTGTIEEQLQEIRSRGVLGMGPEALMLLQAYGGLDLSKPVSMEDINRAVENAHVSAGGNQRLARTYRGAAGSEEGGIALMQRTFGGSPALMASLLEGRPSGRYGEARRADIARGVPGPTTEEMAAYQSFGAGGFAGAATSSVAGTLTTADATNLGTGMVGAQAGANVAAQTAALGNAMSGLAKTIKEYEHTLIRVLTFGRN